MSKPTPSDPGESAPSGSPSDQRVPENLPRTTFEALAAGAREVLIDHAGQVYRLRVTRNEKLILNK